MTDHVDPRIEPAARALYASVNKPHAERFGWDEVNPRWQENYRSDARAALAAADKAAVLHASHHVRRDWANYIETWEATIGGPVCNPQNIVAALRAKGTPFGVSASDRGTE